MERIHNEPLSALGHDGRFLESIVNSLYQKHYKTMKKLSNLVIYSLKDKSKQKRISQVDIVKIFKNCVICGNENIFTNRKR